MKMNKKEFASETETLLLSGGEFEYLEDEETFQFRDIEDFFYQYESIEIAIDELLEFQHIDETTENYLRKKYSINI